jgi:hypothetical protein
MTLNAPLELRAGADRWYFVTQYVLFLPAMIAIATSPASFHWTLFLGAGLATALFLSTLQSLAMRRYHSITLYAAGPCTVKDLLGEDVMAQLIPGAWTTRWVTILPMRTETGTLRLTLCSSANRPADYRRMLVYVRNREFEDRAKRFPLAP